MSTGISRRRFLRSAALSSAVLPLLLEASAQPADTAGVVRLGVASYTFRSFERAQLIEFMQQLRNTRLNAKDVKDHLPFEPAPEATASQAYRSAGVALHAVGTVYFTKDEDADVRAKFEYAKRAGVGVIVAGDPTPEILPRIERFVKEYDIRFAIHNHGPEDKVWPSPLDVLKAVNSMDPRMGCCIDVGHTLRAGTDVVEAIRQAGPRLLNIHMKDLTDSNAKESQVAVGQGQMPVRAIFQALLDLRYPGFVDLEYEIHADDPMPGVVESFAYMRGVLAGMKVAA